MHLQTEVKFKEDISYVLHLEYSFYGAENWPLQKVDQKYLESFEIWCWRRMEISWTDRVKNELLQRVKQDINILQTIKRRNANWFVHTFHRNCVLRQVIKRKIEERIEVRKKT